MGMIRSFKGTDTDFTSNGDKIIQPVEAVIYKNAEEEYLELKATIDYKDYLVQDNILVVDTQNGKKGYRIHNPEIDTTISIKAWLIYQENTPYPEDREVVISYGKNLSGCKVVENWDEVVTKIIPIGYDEMTLPEEYLEVPSPHQRIYERTIEFDLSPHLEFVVEQLDDNIAEAESQINNLSSSKVNLENSISAYENAIESLEIELDAIQERIDGLGDSETELKEKDILEGELLEIQGQIDGLTDEKEATETALAQTIIDLDTANDNLVSSSNYRKNLIIDDLRTQAQTYLNNNLYPQINYEIESHLEEVTEIGDTVKVRHERMGIDMLAYVISYEFNVLTNKYQKVEFGTLKPHLRSLINELERRIYSVTKGIDTVSTLIEQMNDQIVLKIDDNGRIGLFRLGRDQYGTEVSIKADNIRLEGLITANGYFKVLEDGSIEAVNGKFKGHIDALTGTIAGFDFTDDSIKGGLYYNDNGKFFRISPLSSFSGDGEGGSNPNYATIDLGTVEPGGQINTNIHLRNDGYARFGLVREGGYSVRLNDYLRYLSTGGETGTDTIFYSQNFRINTDGTVNIKSDDIAKALKSINVTKSSGQISKLDITFEDNSSASLNVEYNAGGDITKVGDTVINY